MINCRLCLIECARSTSVFTQDNQICLSDLIYKYLDLKIELTDVYSTKVCLNCSKTVKDIHNYCEYIHNCQLTLQQQSIESIEPIKPAFTSDIKSTFENINDEKNYKKADSAILENIVDDTPNLSLKTVAQENETLAEFPQVKTEYFSDEEEFVEENNFKENGLGNDEDYQKSSEDALTNTDDMKDRTCPICSKTYITVKSMKNHMRNFHKKMPDDIKSRTCPICSKILLNKGSLRCHVWRYHNMTRPYACKICSRSFVTSFGLVVHNKKCVGKNAEIAQTANNQASNVSNAENTCKICNFKAKSRLSLYNHMGRNHKGEKLFSCKSCALHFVTEETLQNHLRRFKKCANGHNSQADDEHICTICNKVFRSDSLLKEHTEKAHKNLNLYKCESCDLQLSLRHELYFHFRNSKTCTPTQDQLKILSDPQQNDHHEMLKAHTIDKDDIEYRTCEICAKVWDTKAALANHIHCRHSNAISFECKICSEKFTTKSVFHRHIRDCEPEDIEYRKCAICKRTLKNIEVLKNHMRKNHNGENPFDCGVCEGHFKCLDELEKHVVKESPMCKSDTGFDKIENYKLELKLAKFELKTSVRKKEKRKRKITKKNTDEPEELRICIICNKIFDQISVLSGHMYNNHKNIKPFSCKNCNKKFALRRGLMFHLKAKKKCQGSEEVITLPENLNEVSYRDPYFQTCYICKTVFNSCKELAVHGQITHKSKLMFKCKSCCHTFERRNELIDHMKNVACVEIKEEVSGNIEENAEERNENFMDVEVKEKPLNMDID